jgi:hypothetical protein
VFLESSIRIIYDFGFFIRHISINNLHRELGFRID